MAADYTKAGDLRSRTSDELNTFIRDKEAECLKLRFQHATGQLENVRRVKLVKKEIARAKMALGEKQRAAAQSA